MERDGRTRGAAANAEVEFDAERFSVLEDEYQRQDGYAAEAHASAILEGLGLPSATHHDPLSTLSGGFKLRVLLAQVLASSPDVLLLDEPTNHLDILSIRWLETFLRDFAGPAVVISHDHRFLDNISTHILDVDYQTVTMPRVIIARLRRPSGSSASDAKKRFPIRSERLRTTSSLSIALRPRPARRDRPVANSA